MVGVNLNNLDSLIKKNNMHCNNFDSDKKKLFNAINSLEDCYSGSSLEYLFYEPQKEKNNINTISNILKNYSNVLSKVKLSYQKQDYNLKVQLNRINSNL